MNNRSSANVTYTSMKNRLLGPMKKHAKVKNKTTKLEHFGCKSN